MPNNKLQATLDQILDGVNSLLTIAEELLAKQHVTKARRKLSRSELYTDDFMTLWNTYNKKTGKTEAAKSYRAFKRRQIKTGYYREAGFETPEEMLLEKIKAYVQAWPPARIETGDYRVHLSTFIRQDRWMEDPSDWTASDNSFERSAGPVWTE